MRISDWSSDVCSSDLLAAASGPALLGQGFSGEVDELRVAGVALPQAAFLLAAGTEGQGAKLLTFDTAVQIESAGQHHFDIMFSALTLAAWLVTGIIGLMWVLANWVRLTKALLLSPAGRSATRRGEPEWVRRRCS